ncbi:MAG: hypothetical protein E5Y25_18120 [Mesorhizobium sp.]|nr:MAG: hypothetical protein E5Y25_18120 [Mesorhizobium sp.]
MITDGKAVNEQAAQIMANLYENYWTDLSAIIARYKERNRSKESPKSSGESEPQARHKPRPS